MSIVNSKFLPMSLTDIAAAIDELRDAVRDIQATAGSEEDFAPLNEKIDALSETVSQIQDAVDGQDFNSLQAKLDEMAARLDVLEGTDNDPGARIDELVTRIETLEEAVGVLSQPDDSQAQNDALSERVEQLEAVNSEFFG